MKKVVAIESPTFALVKTFPALHMSKTENSWRYVQVKLRFRTTNDAGFLRDAQSGPGHGNEKNGPNRISYLCIG